MSDHVRRDATLPSGDRYCRVPDRSREHPFGEEAPGQITFLVCDGDDVRPEDDSPSDDDLGRLVSPPERRSRSSVALLPTEVHSEPRSRLELANHA